MPTVTLVGTPDPEEDLRERVKVLEQLVEIYDRRIENLETTMGQFLDAYRSHVHAVTTNLVPSQTGFIEDPQ